MDKINLVTYDIKKGDTYLARLRVYVSKGGAIKGFSIDGNAFGDVSKCFRDVTEGGVIDLDLSAEDNELLSKLLFSEEE